MDISTIVPRTKVMEVHASASLSNGIRNAISIAAAIIVIVSILIVVLIIVEFRRRNGLHEEQCQKDYQKIIQKRSAVDAEICVYRKEKASWDEEKSVHERTKDELIRLEFVYRKEKASWDEEKSVHECTKANLLILRNEYDQRRAVDQNLLNIRNEELAALRRRESRSIVEIGQLNKLYERRGSAVSCGSSASRRNSVLEDPIFSAISPYSSRRSSGAPVVHYSKRDSQVMPPGVLSESTVMGSKGNSAASILILEEEGDDEGLIGRRAIVQNGLPFACSTSCPDVSLLAASATSLGNCTILSAIKDNKPALSNRTAYIESLSARSKAIDACIQNKIQSCVNFIAEINVDTVKQYQRLIIFNELAVVNKPGAVDIKSVLLPYFVLLLSFLERMKQFYAVGAAQDVRAKTRSYIMLLLSQYFIEYNIYYIMRHAMICSSCVGDVNHCCAHIISTIENVSKALKQFSVKSNVKQDLLGARELLLDCINENNAYTFILEARACYLKRIKEKCPHVDGSNNKEPDASLSIIRSLVRNKNDSSLNKMDFELLLGSKTPVKGAVSTQKPIKVKLVRKKSGGCKVSEESYSPGAEADQLLNMIPFSIFDIGYSDEGFLAAQSLVDGHAVSSGICVDTSHNINVDSNSVMNLVIDLLWNEYIESIADKSDTSVVESIVVKSNASVVEALCSVLKRFMNDSKKGDPNAGAMNLDEIEDSITGIIEHVVQEEGPYERINSLSEAVLLSVEEALAGELKSRQL